MCDVVAILVISLTTRLVYNVLVLSWAGCRDFFGPFGGISRISVLVFSALLRDKDAWVFPAVSS